MAVQVGAQVGEYRLVRELGSGTFGTVYQAEHVLLGTQVAIKVLPVQMTEAERLKLRAEARRQAALEHPHIVPVLTYAEQPVPYLVMKYAPNGTLAQRYPAGQRQPLTTILPHVRQIAEGLQHAHDQQTLHLDLKPANVLLGNRQEALITDFGISLILHQHQTHQTVGHIAGTPAYMALEQLQQKPGKASDQYALATMVYQWLTGTLPFTGNVVTIMFHKASQNPPLLLQHAPDLPPAVEQVVLRALARDPQDRFDSVQAFADALTQASQAYPTQHFMPAPTQVAPPRLPPAFSLPRPPIGVLLITCRGRSTVVNDVAWSPDGSSLASANADGTLLVWGAVSGRLLLACRGHTGEALSVAWAPNGRRLASASQDKTIRIWDAVSGRTIVACQGHRGAVGSVAWSPDGACLASASQDKTVHIWYAASGSLLLICQGHTDQVRGVDWSPDGGRLASASLDGTVRVWDAASGKLLLTCQGHMKGVLGVAWSPDGMFLASSSQDKAMHVWDAASGQLLLTCRHGNAVESVAWSPNGNRLASCSVPLPWDRQRDPTVRVWDAANGRCLFTYHGHTDAAKAVDWSPDGNRIASGGLDKTVQVWSSG